MAWPGRQFFEDDKGILSMSRLLCFLAFFPASFVVVTTRDPAVFSWYLWSYVASYVAGKGFDMVPKLRKDDQ